MEDKILLQVKTSCPFPLLIYKTTIKYNEVKKASGIAYIILDIIQKEENRSIRISEILLKLGIPTDLHYIFGQEIVNLISTGIVASRFDISYFSSPEYFKQITIADVELTEKGKKLFLEGAIPTGAEKALVKDIYFNPVTRRFDIESKFPYTALESSFLGDSFLERVDIDISGMEDFINANSKKIGLKLEERIVSYECEEPQKMQIHKEDGMTIIVRSSGAEFKFNSTDEMSFFNKYYSSKLMTEGMLAKDKYKFVDANKNLIDIPTISIEELRDAVEVFIPYEAQKEAKNPCKFFFSRNRLSVIGCESAIKVDKNTTNKILDSLSKNADFALLDKSGIKYYCALNVSMPCKNFGDNFEMNLLVKKEADKESLNKALQELYSFYYDLNYTSEIGEAILFIVESLKDIKYISNYADNQLAKFSSCDEKIDILLKLNSSLRGNVNWKNYFKNTAFDLFNQSICEINLDNMIYKNKVLTPIKDELKISNLDYIKSFSSNVLNEDQDLIYQALDAAGFTPYEILSVVNVVDIFMNKIINGKGEKIYSNTRIVNKFNIVNFNLQKMNEMLGIDNYKEYTLKEDYNINDFFETYRTLKDAKEQIDKFSEFSKDKFDVLNKYLEIYEPIQEFLSIEREASSNPDKITKKYITENLSRGRFKEAICDLYIKLQYDLRKKLKVDDRTEAFELINRAKKENLINEKQCDELHRLRKIRNSFQHPEKKKIPFNKADIEVWRDIVFALGATK